MRLSYKLLDICRIDALQAADCRLLNGLASVSCVSFVLSYQGHGTRSVIYHADPQHLPSRL